MKQKNRWLIALSAVGIHISIGSVYAWSVFSKPLMKTMDWSLKEVSFTFSLAIIFLGLSAAFMGTWVESRGPKKSGRLSAYFFASGLLLAGLAVYLENLYLLYLGYGIIGGIGLGVGYITPVSTLVKWFPDRRGMATGLAIMGFGFAAMIASPIIAKLIEAFGISTTFLIMACIYFPVMFFSAGYLEVPPKEYMADFFAQAGQDKKSKKFVDAFLPLTAREALKTKRFYYLWLILFINITCGIAIISVASPMAQEIAGLSALSAATMVGVMGLFNGLGRIGWASFSDYIGRPNTYIIFFVFQIFAFFILPHATTPLFFQVLLFAILTCYGGGFASIPAYIGDFFGTKQLSAIHGNILTAWACAGFFGPMLASFVREKTHSYEQTLYIFALFFIFALVVSIIAKLEMSSALKKIRPQP